MKKFITAITVIAIIAVQLIITAISAPTNPLDSEIDIEFIEGNEIIAPVDPDDPGSPLNPGGEGGTSATEAGPLTLNYVSTLDFGQQRITTGEGVYKAKTIRPFVQVTDLRGTGAGWRVTAEANRFQSGSTDSLPGATITLKAGSPASVITDSGITPEVTSNIVLPTSGGKADVIVADEDEGIGTWVARWYPTGYNPSETFSGDENDNVTLTVPANSNLVLATHEGKITWTIVEDTGV